MSLIDYYKDLFNQKSNELDKLRDISTLYDRFSTDPQFKYLDAFFQSSVFPSDFSVENIKIDFMK